MQTHLSLINRHVNTVKDVPASEFIQEFANYLKNSNKFKIPEVSKGRPPAPAVASESACLSFSL